MNCVFCKIAAGEIKAHIVSETESTIAFMDINPASPGHILVIPKQHFESVFDCPDDLLKEIIVESKKIAHLVKEKLKADSVNILNASGKNAQQSTSHLHFHIVPRYKNDNLNLWFHGGGECKKTVVEIYNKLTIE